MRARIEHDGNIFYRINDFPLEVKALLSVLNSLKGIGETEEEEKLVQVFVSALRRNIIMLYPKSRVEGIFELTVGELKAKFEDDTMMENIIRNIKNQLL